MISINGKKYDDYDVTITWDEVSVSCCSEKRNGLAPFISFKIRDNLSIGLEFSLLKETLEGIEVNVKTDIKDYVSDILYADDRGWISLTGEYTCYLTKIHDKRYRLDFSESHKNIIIDSDITIV